MTDPRTLLKDAGYVAVGLGVIAFQRGQVRRRELEKQLAEAGPQIDRLAAAVEDARKLVEERVGDVEAKLAQALDEIRTLLPEQAMEAFESAVGAAKDATGQLLDLVRPPSAA